MHYPVAFVFVLRLSAVAAVHRSFEYFANAVLQSLLLTRPPLLNACGGVLTKDSWKTWNGMRPQCDFLQQ